MQIYHLGNDSWTLGPALPIPRYDIALAMVNGSIYAIGGSRGLFENDSVQVNRYVVSKEALPPILEPKPFPFALAVAATIPILATAGLLFYYKKHQLKRRLLGA